MRYSLWVFVFLAALGYCNSSAWAQLVYYRSPFTPPVKGCDPQFEVFELSSERCGKLLACSGTRICVPPQALQTEDGKPLNGLYTIKYREIRTPTEVILAGIPLQFNRQGVEFQLETLGMFEIIAEQNGKALALKKGQSITVKIPARRRRRDFSLFSFDATEKTWKALGPINYERIDSLTVEATDFGDDYPAFSAAMEADREDEEEANTLSLSDLSSLETEDTVERNLFRRVELSSLGLYNFDRLVSTQNRVHFRADFKFENQQPPAGTTIYVVYDEINSVFHFYLLPDRSPRIFALYPDGRIAIFPIAKALKLPLNKLEGGSYTFELQHVPFTANTPTLVRQFLKL
jgi:hypothetical protein